MFEMIIFFTFLYIFLRRLDVSLNSNGRLKKLDVTVSRMLFKDQLRRIKPKSN